MSNLVTTLSSSYNSEEYLNTFLKNAKNQAHKNLCIGLELVEPSNMELEIIKKYKKKLNISSKVQNSRVSLPAAWNSILNRINSEYYCIWNLDDLRTKKSIYQQYKCLKNNDDNLFVYGNYKIVKNYNSKKGALINESNRENELEYSMILGPFFMFNKKILKKIIGFDEQLLSGSDYDFAIRMARNFKGIHVNKILGYYLNTGNGLSTKSDSLQEIERTVVELRYGLKVLQPELIDKAKSLYDVNHLKINSMNFEVEKFL